MNTKGLEGGRGGGEGSFRTGGVRGGVIITSLEVSLHHWRYHYNHWRHHYIIGGIITSLELSLHHWTSLEVSLHHWRYHYIIGDIITSLEVSLHHWRHHYIIGGIITSLEVSLHHWRHHYIIGGIITSLEISLHHWRYHYIIGGIITSLEVSLHHHIQATAIPISFGVTMVCVLLQHWRAMESTIAMTTVMRMAVQLCVSCKGMVWAHM